mgnify:CR=1 FL=1|jgi:segregation and condensation protein B
MKNLACILEALLFVSGDAVEIQDIKEKLNVSEEELNEAFETLKKRFSEDKGIHILKYGTKLQFCSNPEYVDSVSAVINPVREKELTKAMLETLAIIAYKQPVTRGEIEELRRVDSSYAVQMLSRLNMITVVGRKDAIGKPLLFGTTDDFLRHFSLTGLNDLPEYEELLNRIATMDTIIMENRNLYDSNRPPVSDEEGDVPDFLSDEAIQRIDPD